jgi:TolA-binding protein
MSLAKVLLGVVLAAPAFAGGLSAEAVRQLDATQMRLAQVESLLAAIQDSTRRLEEAQRTMTAQGGSSDDAVRGLRGEIEVLQFEVRSLKEQVERLAADSDDRLLWQEQRIAQVERALGLSPPPMGGAAPPVTGPVAPEGPPTTEPPAGTPETAEAMLELAVEHMQADRSAAARALLDRLISTFPNDPLVPEARYRRAETFFNEAKWDQAVAKFQEVIDRHPRHELASWSMVRQGECYDRKGAPDDAALFWEAAIAQYPGTAAAREASEFLRN